MNGTATPQLEVVLRGIGCDLAGLHEQSRFLNQVLDRLHAENEQLRRQELGHVLLPMVRDLIKLADGWRSRAAALRARDAVDAGEPAWLCGELVEDIAMILERHGVDEFRPVPGAAFDRHEQRAAGARETADQALDGTVAELRRPGYRLGIRVVRFAEVVVFKCPPRAGLDGDRPGDPPREEPHGGQDGEHHGGQQ